MLQDLIGNFYKPFAQTKVFKYNFLASFIVCLAWGYFLYQGAIDPFGGINSLWALFGIANQMLAAIALAVAATIMIKMGKARYAWVGIVPFVFLAVTTLTAGFQKNVLLSGKHRLFWRLRRNTRTGSIRGKSSRLPKIWTSCIRL